LHYKSAINRKKICIQLSIPIYQYLFIDLTGNHNGKNGPKIKSFFIFRNKFFFTFPKTFFRFKKISKVSEKSPIFTGNEIPVNVDGFKKYYSKK
jgi:hypothetical protein